MVLLISLFAAESFGQTVTLNYQSEPLNDVLLDLNDRFKVQVSINSEVANNCPITINQQFPNIEEALKELANRCGLEFVKVSNVYVFRNQSSDGPTEPKPKPTFLYQGMIQERGSDEPLPFSTVVFGNGGVVADENGRFSFRTHTSEIQGTFRYLGYESIDTLLSHGNTLKINLEPRLTELVAVEVISRRDVAPLTNIGRSAGHIQFNDINNSLVPGLSDNLIFNNLRLYPGIMAAGESISDFVIWGSYAGQNHVIYDGISLFSSWGINDDMGRINPYMIKNVEVFKGGYNVQYGDRIGGVVLVGGRSGNRNKAEANINLTNQLASAYVNVPLFNKTTTLQVAGRKTMFDSFDLSADFGIGDSLIVPKYDYSDLNVKLTTSFANSDQLEISGIISEDDYNGLIRDPRRQNIVQDFNTNSTQRGASIRYSKPWKKGGNTIFSMSISEYDPVLTNNFSPRNQQGNIVLARYSSSNIINEQRMGITHDFTSGTKHQFRVSTEYIDSRAQFKTLAGDFGGSDLDESSERWSFFAHDRIQISKDFKVELGIKVDRPSGTDKFHFQPRINADLELDNHWRVHGAWGIYNQFVSKNLLVDQIGNRSEVWMVSDGNNRPVLEATHNVLGINYTAGSLQFGLDAFYKKSTGLQRFRINRDGDDRNVEGEATSKGLELYARKQFGTHEILASYTLSEVKEQFRARNVVFDTFSAPHSQDQEFKAIVSLNFNPVKLSVTNVYGSGFTNRVQLSDAAQNITIEPYWRTDIAVQVPFQFGNTQADVGLSILNLFNRRNVRLNQTVNFQGGARLNTIGIPFTPTFYVNFKF